MRKTIPALRAPQVTVVIPTRGRPALLQRALASVAAQTFTDYEVVVVVDGRDQSTEELLATHHPEVRAVVNEQPVGPSEARNVGVRHARGRWIAVLDDDDEWLPTKLAQQIADMRAGNPENAVTLTQVITRSPRRDYISPERAPAPDEALSEYLLVRRNWFWGGGNAPMSTLIAERDLLLRIPFDSALACYEDTDWLLRVSAAGIRVTWTMTPLSIWYIEEARPRQTSTYAGNWKYALWWCETRRHLMTRRAYGSVVLTRVGGHAASVRDLRGGRIAWREAWRHGQPSARDVLIFVGKWILPPQTTAFLRSRLRFRHRRSSGNS